MQTSQGTLFESRVRFYHQLLVSLCNEVDFRGKKQHISHVGGCRMENIPVDQILSTHSNHNFTSFIRPYCLSCLIYCEFLCKILSLKSGLKVFKHQKVLKICHCNVSRCGADCPISTQKRKLTTTTKKEIMV